MRCVWDKLHNPVTHFISDWTSGSGCEVKIACGVIGISQWHPSCFWKVQCLFPCTSVITIMEILRRNTCTTSWNVFRAECGVVLNAPLAFTFWTEDTMCQQHHHHTPVREGKRQNRLHVPHTWSPHRIKRSAAHRWPISSRLSKMLIHKSVLHKALLWQNGDIHKIHNFWKSCNLKFTKIYSFVFFLRIQYTNFHIGFV